MNRIMQEAIDAYNADPKPGTWYRTAPGLILALRENGLPRNPQRYMLYLQHLRDLIANRQFGTALVVYEVGLQLQDWSEDEIKTHVSWFSNLLRSSELLRLLGSEIAYFRDMEA